MFVSSGFLKGKRLIFKSKKIRPTSSKVKEAFFNIIRPKIKNASFLDLFAGTGALGIEAFSNYAREVFLVDLDTKILKKNLQSLAITNDLKIIKKDAFKAIDILSPKQFDIIYADPPYNFLKLDDLVQKIYDNKILAKDACLVLEHYHKIKVEQAKFNLLAKHNYGDTVLSIFALN